MHDAGWTYRLPTSDEWEYACRGGSSTRPNSSFHFYHDKPTNKLSPTEANIFEGGKGLKRTAKVGSYKPNVLGLHDMHGNVWEWCDDQEKDPAGAILRVGRSGCWNDPSMRCTATTSFASPPSRNHFVGLRVARVRAGKPPS